MSGLLYGLKRNDLKGHQSIRNNGGRIGRSSSDNFSGNLNTSNHDPRPNIRRYNEGSVYRQATRYNPYLSSSTNISSSISGSIEVIISDLDEHLDSQSKQDLTPLIEDSHENSDDVETALIQNIIKQKRSMSYDKAIISVYPALDKTIWQLQEMQKQERINKEKKLHMIKMQILQAIHLKK